MDASKQTRLLITLLCTLMLCACRAAAPLSSPELTDWEEPAEWMHPPQDEPSRKELPNGCFSGLQFASRSRSLEGDEPAGLEIASVIENSPAIAAGLRSGDRLLEARWRERTIVLDAVSDWREIELGADPQERIRLNLERGSRSMDAELVLAARLAPAPRSEPVRDRESMRAGILVREATEAQSRAAGLPPGAGVILIGMARSSPWRRSELRFGDLLTSVDGQRIDHPSRLVEAIRAAKPDTGLSIGYQRDGELRTADVPLSTRERGMREVGIPLVFSWSGSAQRTQWSALIGLLSWESNPQAWRMRLLWLIRFQGGDWERLEELP
jgi:membrane-associated protease RseP (regulator of RpoE activity)